LFEVDAVFGHYGFDGVTTIYPPTSKRRRLRTDGVRDRLERRQEIRRRLHREAEAEVLTLSLATRQVALYQDHRQRLWFCACDRPLPSRGVPGTAARPADSTKSHVFLSYCHDNKEETVRLRNELIELGFDVWWDQQILPGQVWESEIRNALRHSIAVVACFSKEVAARHTSGIYPELREAIEIYKTLKPGSIYIIPVRFSQCEMPALEIGPSQHFSDLQYTDLFPPPRRQAGVEGIATAIRAAQKRLRS
jgi:hypothetical protein